MHKLTHFVAMASFAALISAATPVWAESAPVFDADAFDNAGAEQNQDLPMPPAPGEEAAVTHPAPETHAAAAPQPVQNDAGMPAVQADAHTNSAVLSPEALSAAPPAASSGSAGVSVSTANLSPEQRMRRLEQQLNNLQNSENPSQVQSLQTEVQSLRGQIEQLNHQIDKMQAQQKAAPVPAAVAPAKTTVTADASAPATSDPDASTDSATAKKAAAKKIVASKAQAAADNAATKDQPNVAEEQKIYQTAYDYIKAKKYNDAVIALTDMLKKYPTGQFASNAHYWLGELYGLMGKNDKALDEFSLVLSKFPGSPRVSDAQLKVGLILAAQSKWPDAKRAFKTVINTYPGTASSRLASEQLKQIKLAGH
jgi:tol-pal system protein YbgF